ncbi:MAG: glycosyltransferase family 1 protein, partial [Nitrososphaeria archaeon]
FNKNMIREELEVKYGIKSPYILHVGHYLPRKNTVTLLKAYKKLKRRGIDEKLVIVGIGVWQHDKVLKTVKELALEDDVKLLGYVPEEDLPKLYNVAKLFAFPSLHEAFGLVILEAMACGCPVITSNIFSMPEIAGDAALFINPYDENDLMERIYHFLTNSRVQETLRMKGLKRASLFSWERCAQETLQVYEEVLNGL